MKVRTSLKKLCKHCKMIKRGKKVYVSCKMNPRHKQRQGFATFIPTERSGEIRFFSGLVELGSVSLR